jgi:hypothetical protein
MILIHSDIELSRQSFNPTSQGAVICYAISDLVIVKHVFIEVIGFYSSPCTSSAMICMIIIFLYYEFVLIIDYDPSFVAGARIGVIETYMTIFRHLDYILEKRVGNMTSEFPKRNISPSQDFSDDSVWFASLECEFAQSRHRDSCFDAIATRACLQAIGEWIWILFIIFQSLSLGIEYDRCIHFFA